MAAACGDAVGVGGAGVGADHETIGRCGGRGLHRDGLGLTGAGDGLLRAALRGTASDGEQECGEDGEQGSKMHARGLHHAAIAFTRKTRARNW